MKTLLAPHAVRSDVHSFLTGPHRLLIDNQWVDAQSGQTFAVLDPGTGLEIAQVAEGCAADIDLAVAAARRAFEQGPWAAMKPVERQRLLLRLADLIGAHADELAELETLDSGAPQLYTRNFFIPLAADEFRYMAGWCTKLNGESIPLSAPGDWHAYSMREPVGVVGAIVPWNVPLLLAAQKLAPALAAGCTTVLKPAELTPLAALRFGELALMAGLPPGVINIVTGDGPHCGARLAEHPDVDKIAFTGSTVVGKRIAQAATGNLKKVSLELGGKSPAVVFGDADLSIAIPGVANSIFLNTGQTCVAGSRLFVHRKVYDQVVQGVADIAATLQGQMGHGLNPATRLGPLVSAAQLARVGQYIESARSDGAEVLAGGQRASSGGYFVQPTVLANTATTTAARREEIFGPVLCAIPFDDGDDLTTIAREANHTPYGLAASVWTRDLGTAHKMAKLFRAGSVGINAHGVLDTALPFSGHKQSGWGQDHGKEGLLGYTELKSVAALL